MAKTTENEMNQDGIMLQKVDIRMSFENELKNKLQSGSVDYRVLAEKRMFDEDNLPELVERLVTVFIENTPSEIVDLRGAIIYSDQFAKNKAYLLKLACENVGAHKMVRLLELIVEGRTSYHNTLLLVDGLEEEFFTVYNELIPFSSWNSLINLEA